jgi:formylglycine-generating enzyme required for sulfatase activity
VRLVRLAPFWIDQTPVTNAQFDRFVQQTHYETTAERRGHSLVFDRQQSAWREVAGVSWQHPENPNSSLAGKEQYPVVHVSWHDAVAYAAWADKRLPSEAEYEYAARGGLLDCDYPWGRERAPGAVQLANSWQGPFPEEDLGLDGFRATSPVQQFPPNRFGLYDMAGNVCQWCADWYQADYYSASPAEQPAGPAEGEQRVRRGGSWLAPPLPPDPLRTGHRDHAPPGETTNHTGFRCARSILIPGGP